MTDKTKAVNLTEDEIKVLIKHHGFRLNVYLDEKSIDRINYLNRRLKSFKEPEITADTDALNPNNQQAKSAGWGT